MNSKTLTTSNGPPRPVTVDYIPPGADRFVIGLEEPILDLSRRIVELFSPYVPPPGLMGLEREIHTAAVNIGMASALQLVAAIHRRNVSDNIVLDLICTEVSQALYSVGQWDRMTLMGIAADLQHCAEMAVSEVITRYVPRIDDPSYCTVVGYRSNFGPMPNFTVDIQITGARL